MKKAFFNKIKIPLIFKIPDIPQNLQEAYENERMRLSSSHTQFMVKYIVVPLFFAFGTVDLYYAPDYIWLSLFIRLFSIPVCVLVYRMSKSIKYWKYCFLTILVSISFLVHLLTLINTNSSNMHLYFSGYHVVLIGATIFFNPTIKETLFGIIFLYFPYFFICYLRNESFVSCIYDVNMVIGVSLMLFANRVLVIKVNGQDFINQQQLKIDAQVGENIAQISHDTRAPLMALRAIDGGYFPPEKINEILKISVARLIELVDGITQSASQLYINRQNQDLEQFFKECSEYISFLHPSKTIRWKLDFNKKIYPMDKNKMKRVVINLINNAVKAVEGIDGGLVEIIAITNEKLNLSVCDNGPGFENVELIFKKGYSKHGSSGLGLAFCKTVIEEHGGELKAVRNDQKTVFTFTF